MYNYALNEEQKEIAYDFLEILETMEENGISIIREKLTGVLCLINTKGYELDKTGKKLPVFCKLSTDAIETDNIICAIDNLIDLDPDESINVVPQIKIVGKED